MIQDGFQKKGFIIDGFPLTMEDTTAFEEYFYPVTAGMYFQNEAWSKDKSILPAVIPPTYFRRDVTYNEAAVEEACAYEGLKAIKILNAEHLSEASSKPLTSVIKAFLDFYQEILSTEGPPVKESINFKRFVHKVGDDDELWHYIERVKREKFPRSEEEIPQVASEPIRIPASITSTQSLDKKRKETPQGVPCDDRYWYKNTSWYKKLKKESSDPDFWKWSLLRKWGIVPEGPSQNTTTASSSDDPHHLHIDDITIHPITHNYQLDPKEKLIQQVHSEQQAAYVIPKTGSPIHFDDPYKTVVHTGDLTGNYLKDVKITESKQSRAKSQPSSSRSRSFASSNSKSTVIDYTPYAPEPATTLRVSRTDSKGAPEAVHFRTFLRA